MFIDSGGPEYELMKARAISHSFWWIDSDVRRLIDLSVSTNTDDDTQMFIHA